MRPALTGLAKAQTKVPAQVTLPMSGMTPMAPMNQQPSTQRGTPFTATPAVTPTLPTPVKGRI